MSQPETPLDLGMPDLASPPPRPDLAQQDLAPSVLSLSADLVLTGTDTWVYPPPGSTSCRIEGNGFSIVTKDPFTGTVDLRGCQIVGLGRMDRPALDLKVTGTGSLMIRGNTFDASGIVILTVNGQSTARFERNRILESALVPVGIDRYPASGNAAVFVGKGDSESQKWFSGNVFLRSWALFELTKNWLIGGDNDGATNYFVAPRGGLELINTANMVIRGNYISTMPERKGWAQVTSIDILAPFGPTLIEHNVVRGGQWVVRGLLGELRYNVVGDFSGHNWVQGPRPGSKIHHNVMIFNTPPILYDTENGVLVYGNAMASGEVEIYNNTFDGGGKVREFTQPGIMVNADGFLHSLRSNAFVNFPFTEPVFSVGYGEPKMPRPDRLGYADYNLFFNPEAETSVVFGLGVKGKVQGSLGFGSRDVYRDPQFVAPPGSFPFSDADLLTRRVTVSQILAFYKRAYTPQAGSPLIDAGDEKDGDGVDIGAIDAGRPHAAAKFGGFPLP